jgi:hypothetical protein
LLSFNFHFSVRFCNSFVVIFCILTTQHNSFHFLFALSDPLLHTFPMPFYDSSFKWY